jgi:hypothetical protein
MPMKTIVVVALAFLSLAASPPQAQEGAWTAPDGTFTLTFPAGWRDAAIGREPEEVLQIVPQAPGEGLRICAVRFDDRPTIATQTDANRWVASWDEAQMRRNAGESMEVTSVVRFENADVDRIRVASFVYEASDVRIFQRFFVIAQGGRSRLYHMSCGVSLPANAADLAGMEAFLGSLSFSR